MRMSGTYMLPWGFLYPSSFTSQSGDYFFREVQIRDANNTNVAIRIESAGGPLRVDEDLGQPHHEEVQDVGQPVDRGIVRSLQHAEHEHDHRRRPTASARHLPAADGDHRAAHLAAGREVSVLRPRVHTVHTCTCTVHPVTRIDGRRISYQISIV